MDQLEVFHHLSTSNLGFPRASTTDFMRAKWVEAALAEPWLMNAGLAFAARHLAEERPARGAHYRRMAVELQMHAIRLFNERVQRQINRENYVAFIFFTWTIGTQMLSDLTCDPAETPANESGDATGGGSLDFLSRFLVYFRTYRGIKPVAINGWNMLLETELSGVLRAGDEEMARMGTGPETAPLLARIRDDNNLDNAQRNACEIALGRIQYGIDLYLSKRELFQDDIQREMLDVVFKWSLAVEDNFSALLLQEQEQAISMLAYLGVILHWCRNIWAIGDSGRLLVESVAIRLGPEWRHLLAWPLDAIRDKDPQ